MQGKDISIADAFWHKRRHRLSSGASLRAAVARVEFDKDRLRIELEQSVQNGPTKPLSPFLRREKLTDGTAERRFARRIGPVDDVDSGLQVIQREARRLETVQTVDTDSQKMKFWIAHAVASWSTSFRSSFQACRFTRARLSARSAGTSPPKRAYVGD